MLFDLCSLFVLRVKRHLVLERATLKTCLLSACRPKNTLQMLVRFEYNEDCHVLFIIITDEIILCITDQVLFVTR